MGFSLITNRIANSTSDTRARQITTALSTMRHVNPVHNGLNMPVSILIVIVFMASVSTAIIYPGMTTHLDLPLSKSNITDNTSVRTNLKCESLRIQQWCLTFCSLDSLPSFRYAVYHYPKYDISSISDEIF